jgi:SAM-dependent methyltransferase
VTLFAEPSVQDYVHGGAQKDEYSLDEVVDVPCPLCGEATGEQLYREHAVVGIKRCPCGLVYTSPRIRQPETIYWGDRDLYYAEARLVFEGRASHHRDPNYLAELHRIERHRKPPGRFLDVGCNMGMLLRIARGRGWTVAGVEPSPSLAPLAARWGFPVHNCFLHEVPDSEKRSFDVVALSDVLEHIGDPRTFLDQARQFLKPDGVLYAKVPNALWSIAKQRVLGLLGRRPRKGLWDSCEHVVHYTDRTLRRMMEACGYEVRSSFIEPPVQTPNWHELVGHYYQYPTPWPLDWKRKLVRSTAYRLSLFERVVRAGSVGFLAPNVGVVATVREPPLLTR